MSSATVIRPTERGRYFVDPCDGADASSKRSDEILGYTWDLDKSGELETSETVSSVTYVDAGVTRTGAGSTTTTVYFNVTGTGETEITVVLSTGRKLQRVARWYGTDHAPVSDYR